MEHQKTPIWLEMKPDFIDENFVKVVDYLANPQTPKDNFYYETIALFEKRVRNQFSNILELPIYEDDLADDEIRKKHREEKIYLVRLLLAFLLSTDEDHSMRKSTTLAIFSYLCQIEPTYSGKLLELQLSQLVYENPKLLKISWSDVRDFQPQIFINRILRDHSLGTKQTKSLGYSKKGVLLVEKGYISLAPNRKALESNRIAKTAATMTVANNLLRLFVEKENKIKASDLQDFEKVELFMKEVTHAQQKCTDSQLKQFKDGDLVEVIVLSSHNNQMRVRTVATDFETIEGVVDFNYMTHKNTLTYDYHADDFCRAYVPGDLLEAQIDSVNRRVFSFFEPMEDCHTNDENIGALSYMDHDVRAFAASLWNDPNTGTTRVRWVTEDGLIMQTFHDGVVSPGDYAILHVLSTTERFVNAEIVDVNCEEFDVQNAKDLFLQNYSHDHDESLLEKSRTIEDIDLRVIASSILAHQRQVPEVNQRLLLLCFVRFLCTFIQKDTDAAYIAFVQEYLKVLVFFARGIKKLPTLAIDSSLSELELVTTRMRILDILRLCGTEDPWSELQQLQTNSDSPLLQKLARLAQAYNNLQSVASDKVLAFIRREIVSSLAISSEENADLEESHGDLLGEESSNTEFKTSFVFPPDNNMQAAQETQARNIMRGLCAFLNTKQGGTLYIGVNDGGKVVGVSEDMKYLRKLTMDSYVRHIQDFVKPFFPNAYSNFEFSDLYDNQVVAIKVSPYKYGVVKLENVAYRRWGRENRPMSVTEMEQLLSERQFNDQYKMRNILDITTGIEQQKQVILHGYSSNNSSTQRDRVVEAFAFTNDYNNIWCFEPESGVVKMFTITRVGNVEVTDVPWQHKAQHKQGEMDIFHMTGTTPIPVVLQLDMMAHNLLIEEFPQSQQFLKEVPKSKEPTWILTTCVYNVRGIGRFCIGLMPNITILEGDALKEYIKDYFQKWCN